MLPHDDSDPNRFIIYRIRKQTRHHILTCTPFLPLSFYSSSPSLSSSSSSSSSPLPSSVSCDVPIAWLVIKKLEYTTRLLCARKQTHEHNETKQNLKRKRKRYRRRWATVGERAAAREAVDGVAGKGDRPRGDEGHSLRQGCGRRQRGSGRVGRGSGRLALSL